LCPLNNKHLKETVVLADVNFDHCYINFDFFILK